MPPPGWCSDPTGPCPEVGSGHADIVDGGLQIEEWSVYAVVDADDLVVVTREESIEPVPPGTEVVAHVGPWHEVIDKLGERGGQAAGGVRHHHEPLSQEPIGRQRMVHVRIEAAVGIEVGKDDRPADCSPRDGDGGRCARRHRRHSPAL